ncbi:hypothetical protein TNCV_4292051 [Trichonephila clavipes]|uniref:Uncharacterized protein n=1 Tax=Trichonephila clavipes TaxID=2585209 RepID=A0A8X6RGF3_TRICX|nr:hypothetical protein TNCV_4292051 [Trichonephila clavipes]
MRSDDDAQIPEQHHITVCRVPWSNAVVVGDGVPSMWRRDSGAGYIDMRRFSPKDLFPVRELVTSERGHLVSRGKAFKITNSDAYVRTQVNI